MARRSPGRLKTKETDVKLALMGLCPPAAIGRPTRYRKTGKVFHQQLAEVRIHNDIQFT